MSQSEISAALKHPELQLSKQLYVRSGRGISPSSSAIALAHKIEEPAVSVCRIEHPLIDRSIALDHHYQEQHIALKIRRNGQTQSSFYLTERKTA